MSNDIFVDVDGTLANAFGEPNVVLIGWLQTQKQNGFNLVLWSMRGKEHALAIAQKFGVVDMFSVIISKPRFIVDDKGWRWIQFTRPVLIEEIINGENLPAHVSVNQSAS